jgi:Na+/H+ antiporter NhaA
MNPFIGALAFEGQDALYQTRLQIGVLAGSLLSALAGIALSLAQVRPRCVSDAPAGARPYR